MIFRMIDNVMIRITNHIQKYLLTSGIRSIQIVNVEKQHVIYHIDDITEVEFISSGKTLIIKL